MGRNDSMCWTILSWGPLFVHSCYPLLSLGGVKASVRVFVSVYCTHFSLFFLKLNVERKKFLHTSCSMRLASFKLYLMESDRLLLFLLLLRWTSNLSHKVKMKCLCSTHCLSQNCLFISFLLSALIFWPHFCCCCKNHFIKYLFYWISYFNLFNFHFFL